MNNSLKIYFLLLFLTPFVLSAQSFFINSGAIVKVETGVNLRVEQGNILNDSNGLINNLGNINLDGDFTQLNGASYSGAAGSLLRFEGTSNQYLNGDAPLDIGRVRVDNNSRLILTTDVNINIEVDLSNNSKIELGANDLILEAGATITGYDVDNFVITNSIGVLQQEVGPSNVVFPVGRSSYNPATLNNLGALDNFRVRVFDQVLEQGTTGTAETSNAVNRTWIIEEAVAGGSNVDMTLQWTDPAGELPFFDRNNSGIAHHLAGTSWDNPSAYTPATNIAPNTWTQNRTGLTSFSPFVVRDVDMDLPIELLFFEAERQNSYDVLLSWATVSELNNKGFYIERMLEEESDYISIAWVEGHGTSLELIEYNLNDANSYSQTSYYRLRQIDFDGTESFSEIRAVEGSDKNSNHSVEIFPVPARNELYIRFGILPKGVESGNIRIYNMLGQLLYDVNLAILSNQILTIDAIADWPPATYLLQIRLEDASIITQKVVKK